MDNWHLYSLYSHLSLKRNWGRLRLTVRGTGEYLMHLPRRYPDSLAVSSRWRPHQSQVWTQKAKSHPELFLLSIREQVLLHWSKSLLSTCSALEASNGEPLNQHLTALKGSKLFAPGVWVGYTSTNNLPVCQTHKTNANAKITLIQEHLLPLNPFLFPLHKQVRNT